MALSEPCPVLITQKGKDVLPFSRSLYSAEKSALTYKRQCGWEFSTAGPALHSLH